MKKEESKQPEEQSVPIGAEKKEASVELNLLSFARNQIKFEIGEAIAKQISEDFSYKDEGQGNFKDKEGKEKGNYYQDEFCRFYKELKDILNTSITIDVSLHKPDVIMDEVETHTVESHNTNENIFFRKGNDKENSDYVLYLKLPQYQNNYQLEKKYDLYRVDMSITFDFNDTPENQKNMKTSILRNTLQSLDLTSKISHKQIQEEINTSIKKLME